MPPMSMLPKNGETKEMYQLPNYCKYEVVDNKGNFVTKGEGEWIDVTKYEKGVYFIRFNNETVQYEVKR